jgi:hypothetical protein
MELHKIRKQINEYVLLNSKTIKLHMKYENIILNMQQNNFYVVTFHACRANNVLSATVLMDNLTSAFGRVKYENIIINIYIKH